MEHPLIVAADPRLFIRATALIVVALVAHAFRLYGWRRGLRIMLTLLVVAYLKETTQEGSPYEVSPAIAPGGVPVGIIFGWFIVGMLALEWSRLAALTIRPETAGGLMRRVLGMIFFGAAAGNALEPIGQAAGWWRWPGETFPYIAHTIWAGMVPLLTIPALLVGSLVSLKFLGRLTVTVLAIAAMFVGSYLIFVVGGISGLALPGNPTPAALAVMGVLLPAMAVMMYRSRALTLHPAMLRPRAAGSMGLANAIPSLCTWAIIWVLVRYALESPFPGFWIHCIPLAALTLIMDAHWLDRWARATARRRKLALRRIPRVSVAPPVAAAR